MKCSKLLLLFIAYLFVCRLYMVRYSWESSVPHIEICCKKLLEHLANGLLTTWRAEQRH